MPSPDVYLACLNSVDGWGGTLTWSRDVARQIIRQGHSATLLGVGNDAARDSAATGHPPGINVRVKALPVLWRAAHWRLVSQLAAALKKLPPPRTAFLAYSPFWVCAARRVWPAAPIFYQYPCLLSNCLPFTWRDACPPSLWARLDLSAIRRAERAAFQQADATLVATESLCSEIRTFCHNFNPTLLRVNYGAQRFDRDRRAQSRAELGLGANDRLVLWVGVCDLNKSPRTAIAGLADLPCDYQLAIVGDGPQHAACEQLAARLNVAKRLHLPGACADLARWYAAADVVISTSAYDAFPNAIQAAIASGIPVVVPHHDPPFTFAGIAENVAGARCGALYDRESSADLAAAILEVCESATARQVSDAGRAFASRHFNWDELIERVLGSTRTAPQSPADAGEPVCA